MTASPVQASAPSVLGYYPCPVAHGPRTFALRIEDASMKSRHRKEAFLKNEIIFVDPDRAMTDGCLVVAKVNDDPESVIFRKLMFYQGRYLLFALNPDWPEEMVALGARSSIVGVVIGKHVER